MSPQPDNVLPIAGEPPPEDAPPPPQDGGAPAPETGGGGSARKPRRPKGAKEPNWGDYARLMRNFALLYGTDTVWDGETRRILKVNALRLAFGSDLVKMWLASRERRMVLAEHVVFEPALDLEDDPARVNLYDGLAMEPKKGECGPILELLHHLCAESAPTAEGAAAVMAWVLRWLALPLQRPGTKMRSALVFHGPQGAGKNLLFEVVAKIYGKYALVVGQDQLEDKFNDWASMKLFLIGDEVVARAELYHQKNKLKAFITGETIQINAKMLPLRTEANHVNVVFLSNDQQPLALEEGDRRYFVVYTPPRRADDLYARVADCLAAGGHEAFLHYLLALKLGAFNEFEIPPMTRAKADLIELGLKAHERFVREWLGGFLPLPLWVCSTEQLYRAFKRWAAVTGERFPPPQVTFSKGVEKIARGRLACRVVHLDAPVQGKLHLRIWQPEDTGPPEGEPMGAWAGECIDAFEQALGRFAGQAEAPA